MDRAGAYNNEETVITLFEDVDDLLTARADGI